MDEPVYHVIINNRGRFTVPKPLREEADIKPYDILRLKTNRGKIVAKKVTLVELDDYSPEALEGILYSAISGMNQEKLQAVIVKAAKRLEERSGQNAG